MIERLATASGLRGYVGQGIYGDAVNQVYNESLVCVDRKIGFNIGTRFFETIGSGGFLLTNRNRVDDGMDDLAVDGHHFISYDDSYEDLEKKVRYYIENADIREKIAKAGHKYFYENHRYVNRWQTILKDLGL
jgi:spore maturation protein CgeB